MFQYIVKRLLLFIPTIIIVSCITFFLSKQVSADQVSIILNIQGIDDADESWNKDYDALYKKLNLDLPEFYFSTKPSYAYDIENLNAPSHEKEFISTISGQKYSSQFIKELIDLIHKTSAPVQKKLLFSSDLIHLKKKIKAMNASDLSNNLSSSLISLIDKSDSNKVKWHYPIISFNGFQNQYHYWIKDMLRGDFGNSLLDMRPITDKLWEAMRWSIILVFLNLLFAILFAFPIGVYNGMRPNSLFDNISNNLLFGLYAIPKFWLATLMIIFFTTAEYGSWTNIFPSTGIWNPNGVQGFYAMIWESWHKLILPVMILVIPDAAYLSRLIRAGVQEESKKEYVKTALSKGLSLKEITIRHILPNSLIPSISLLVGTLPGALASSLVIEVIFNIPGIGRLMYESILNADWAMVYPIVLIISILSVFVFLIGDILMAYLNPKIKLG